MKNLFVILLSIMLQISSLGAMCMAEDITTSTTLNNVPEETVTEVQGERRAYERYNIHLLVKPVIITSQKVSIGSLIDISRGGVGLRHNNTLHEGDILPIQITYKDISISTKIKIVSATEQRAGGEYIDITPSITHKLLYLSILLEADNHLLKTKLSV